MSTLDEMKSLVRMYGSNRIYYMTIYFVSKSSHARVDFNGYHVLDLIEFIENMESQGFKECSWVRWKWRELKSWFTSKNKAVVEHEEMRAEISET